MGTVEEAFGESGGGGRIRTFVDISRQIYSLLPLTARPPLPNARKYKENSDVGGFLEKAFEVGAWVCLVNVKKGLYVRVKSLKAL